MEKKLGNLIGTNKSDFDQIISNGNMFVRPARLIPVIKPGDEMALTSVILSSLRLIKEFRELVFSEIKMTKGGQLYVFTEVVFPGFEDSRIDGLVLIVKSNVIKDAAIFEMKNGAAELDVEQINKYLEIAKNFSIPKIITVSNQFVSEPTQTPIQIKNPKSIDLYHFSWSFLLTIAHILLFKNDINIEDEDQIEIMKEVVNYLEDAKSGVCGFNQMKPGWKEIVEKINSGTRIKQNDPDLDETVNSWQQEEKDMALILSKNLGVFVSSGNPKYKNNLKARLDDDKKLLLDKKFLVSILKVKNAVSDIKISALFEKRIIEMSVTISPPDDKTIRGQIGWLNKQIDICKKKSEEIFIQIENESFLEASIKNSSKNERFFLQKIDNIADELKGKDIKDFKIVYIKDFGKSFSNRKKFVEIIEKMLIDFYSAIVQHLKNWEKPAPKIKEKPIIVEELVAKEKEIPE